MIEWIAQHLPKALIRACFGIRCWLKRTVLAKDTCSTTWKEFCDGKNNNR